jgi:hypothetical protein
MHVIVHLDQKRCSSVAVFGKGKEEKSLRSSTGTAGSIIIRAREDHRPVCHDSIRGSYQNTQSNVESSGNPLKG